MSKTIEELFTAMIDFSFNRKKRDAHIIDPVLISSAVSENMSMPIRGSKRTHFATLATDRHILETKEKALKTLTPHLKLEAERLLVDCSAAVLNETHPSRHLTPIQFSAFLGEVTLSEVLFRQGADIRQKNALDQNAIDIAIKYEKPELAGFLMLLIGGAATEEEIAEVRMCTLVAEAEKSLAVSKKATVDEEKAAMERSGAKADMARPRATAALRRDSDSAEEEFLGVGLSLMGAAARGGRK